MYHLHMYRVAFADTDGMNIVHHSNHNRFFERARVEFLRAAHIQYVDLANEGTHFPVLRTECIYNKPIRFDDLIGIESRISFLSKTRLNFGYRIYRMDSSCEDEMRTKPFGEPAKLVTEGTSEHCCIGPGGKPQRIPAKLLNSLSKYFNIETA